MNHLPTHKRPKIHQIPAKEQQAKISLSSQTILKEISMHRRGGVNMFKPGKHIHHREPHHTKNLKRPWELPKNGYKLISIFQIWHR